MRRRWKVRFDASKKIDSRWKKEGEFEEERIAVTDPALIVSNKQMITERGGSKKNWAITQPLKGKKGGKRNQALLRGEENAARRSTMRN